MRNPGPVIGPVATPGRPRAGSLLCTNWAAYRLEEIWQMVGGEDGRVSWAQAVAWERMAQLCGHQAKRLRHAADELARLWPPERSEAAKVFIAHVVAMAKSMEDSAIAARTTSTALEQLTKATADARRKVAELLDQRQEYEQQYQQREAATLPWLRGHDSLIRYQRDQLDQAARQVMLDLDLVVAEATYHMTLPVRYLGFSLTEPSNPLELLDHGDTIKTMPLVRASVNGTPPGTSSLSPVGVSAPEREFPILAGLSSGELPMTPPVSNISTGTSSGSAEPTRITVPVGIGSYGSQRPASGVMGYPTASNPARPRRGTSPITPRTTASGLTAHGTSMPMLTAPTTVRPSSTQGGVPSGSGASAARRQYPCSEEQSIPPGGVPAVLEPAEEPKHYDPGPGVIGIDR